MINYTTLQTHRYFNPLATLLSGILWYLAVGVEGNYGWLLWIAPFPLLLIARQSSSRITFICTFVAYLIGRLGWVPYLMHVVPGPLVIVFTILLPLLYALTLLGVRRLTFATTSSWTIFIYPAFITAVEFIAASLSADGTAGSIAYTQANYLPVIQIASITGIWGIVFITALFPATLAVALHTKHIKQRQRTLLVGSLLILTTIGWGWIRITMSHSSESYTTGITVIEEKQHQFPSAPDFSKEKAVSEQYISQIKSLAAQGAKLILFPEKVINVTIEQKDSISTLFSNTAKELNISIGGGFTIYKEKTKQNKTLFFTPDGAIQEYMKNFHVNGWEDQFERGNTVGQLKGLPLNAATAICKDMDFPAWLRKYQHEDLLLVPAWDFVVDGWLHSRMAVMRGVENGYTIVRAGRQGRLTVSDYKGAILAEASCENGSAVSLITAAPIYTIDTLYSKFGDWFGITCIIGIMIAYIKTKLSKSKQ